MADDDGRAGGGEEKKRVVLGGGFSEGFDSGGGDGHGRPHARGADRAGQAHPPDPGEQPGDCRRWGSPEVKGDDGCIFRSVREEGFLSLWRGNGSSVLRYYPSVALNFSLKDRYKTLLRDGQSNDHILAGPSANFVAGAAAGCTTLVIVYPLDIAHTCLAADIGKTEVRQFRGIFHFFNTSNLARATDKESSPNTAENTAMTQLHSCL